MVCNNIVSSNTSGTDFNRHVPIKIPKFNRHVPIKILKFKRHVPIKIFFPISIYQPKRCDDSPASSQRITQHLKQHKRRRMRPSGCRPPRTRTKNRTPGARSGPPVGHRQPRPPDLGAPQNLKFNTPITHRNPLFSRTSSRRMRRWPRGVSHRLAIHTSPSSDTLIKQLCRSKPATIVGLCVA